jgi:hypothetical protein
MHIVQLQCLSAQLRNAAQNLTEVRERTAPAQPRKNAMRLIESATAGIIALAAQILVVATILI